MSEDLLRENGIKDDYIARIKEMLTVKELALNEMQIEFVKTGFLDKDRVIISAPTASGKTLLVYLKYSKNLENGKKRMMYLLPYSRIETQLLKKLAVWEKVGIFSTNDYKTYDEGKAQIFVATYAYADLLLLHGQKLTSDFFVFDEIDMVTDDLQGTKTEGSISRIVRESGFSTLFALSATIGSPELLEEWLNCVTFKSDFRPGSLEKTVMQYNPEQEQQELIEEIFLSPENGKQPMLVFYYNTKRCRQMAVKLSKLVAEKNVGKTYTKAAGGIKKIASECDITTEINDQIKCLNSGIAFYFARLQPECKEVIGRLFESSSLDVIFATPALARGINLPMRTVVVPIPFKFSAYAGNVLISRAEMEQMFGRAGRPPFQDKGYGVVLSTDP